MDQVELHLTGSGDLFDFAIAGPDALDVKADFFEDRCGCPDITADVVVTNQGDIVGTGRFNEFALADDIIADRIVGDMVAKGLADTTKTFTVTGDDKLAQLFFHLFSDGIDVIANQPDRALGKHR